MAGDLRTLDLLPTRGLDLSITDDSKLDGNPLRGGVNVRIVDGEIWSREGEDVKKYQVCSQPFVHAVSLELEYTSGGVDTRTIRHFLISHWGVLEVTDVQGTEAGGSDAWSLSVPYNQVAAFTGAVTNGSSTVQITAAGGTPPSADQILILPDGTGTTAFRIMAVTGSGGTGDTVVIDRPFPGGSGSGVTCKHYATFGSWDNGIDHVSDVTWCIWRQTVSHAKGALWQDSGGAETAPYYLENSPAVSAGDIFLVVAFRQPTATIKGPIAIQLNSNARCLFNFMRRSAAWTATPDVGGHGAFTSSDSPNFVSVFANRLIVQREDENGAHRDRTIWWSQQGDMEYWHTGTVAGTPSPTNNRYTFLSGEDPITAIEPLDDTLIVHRRTSQVIVKNNASEKVPFTYAFNSQGLGCVAPKTLINVRGQHYLWSQSGPALFDGSRIHLLDQGIQRVAMLHQATEEWNKGTLLVILDNTLQFKPLCGFYHRARQQIWWKVLRTLESVTSFTEGNASWILYDIDRQTLGKYAFADPGLAGGTFRSDTKNYEFVVRSRLDGSIVQSTQTGKGKDRGANRGDPQIDLEAYFDTFWADMGNNFLKTLVSVEFTFRAFNTAGTFVEEISDIDLTSGADMSYGLTIFRNFDMSLSNEYTVTVDRADLLARDTISDSDGSPCRFQVTYPVRESGKSFKLRFRNNITNRPRPFRISQITLWYVQGEGERD